MQFQIFTSPIINDLISHVSNHENWILTLIFWSVFKRPIPCDFLLFLVPSHHKYDAKTSKFSRLVFMSKSFEKACQSWTLGLIHKWHPLLGDMKIDI